jgi:nucleotide-binding universal stress UspA family protein
MIKDILVSLASDTNNDGVVGYAVSLASTFDAHLTGVAFAQDPFIAGAMFDGVSAAVIAEYQEESKSTATAIAQKFAQTVRGAGITAESRVVDTSAEGIGETFGRLARRYDLSVVGQSENKGPVEGLIIEGALFDSGRPVLVVPYTMRDGFKADRPLLCWDGSRSAARAFSDALPLIAKSKTVEVITIASKDSKKGEIAGADIAHHLARHGIKAELNRIVAPDTDVPNTILSHAADSSADLIVMGGYGHSRLREFVLGGATRGILGSMTVPALLSH